MSNEKITSEIIEYKYYINISYSDFMLLNNGYIWTKTQHEKAVKFYIQKSNRDILNNFNNSLIFNQ